MLWGLLAQNKTKEVYKSSRKVEQRRIRTKNSILVLHDQLNPNKMRSGESQLILSILSKQAKNRKWNRKVHQ